MAELCPLAAGSALDVGCRIALTRIRPTKYLLCFGFRHHCPNISDAGLTFLHPLLSAHHFTLLFPDNVILWQLQNKSWKWNKNPFDKRVGREVYDRMHEEDEA